LAARDDFYGTRPKSAPSTGAEVIEHIVPPEVACFASLGDDASAWLYPEEEAQVRGAVETRLREFTTARTCARLALAKLGLPTGPILRGACREPIWPHGVVGSITHCKGYRAAAVAKQSEILSIGIDAEPNERLPPGVLEQVAVEPERVWLATARPGVHWDRLLFSAKESVFKAWFPLARDWPGFEQAVVSFHPTECTFQVQLPRLFVGDPEIFTGRFMARDALLLTSVVVTQPQRV
jgi:4'-phosphopantetheinyl transferase EntD